jgi:hypothetical protein
MRPRSVSPWMLEWPRSAFMPPPATPILPSSSCTIAPARIICEPTECWVQPSAYSTVIARVGDEVEAISSHAFCTLSFGVPQTLSTTSSV